MKTIRKKSLPPLPSVVEKQVNLPEKSQERLEGKTSIALPVYLVEKIRDYCYWERVTQIDFLEEVLLTFFEGKEVAPRPAPKTKRGPKQK